jgi:DNA-binding GntR family transcriptional regulator
VTEITEAEARDLYEARASLELFILPKIIKNITPDDIASIREHFRKLDMTDPRKWVIRDSQFHLKVAEYAHNDVIYCLLQEILERIYLRYKPQYLGEQRLKEALKEHREILNSLENGNLKEVRNVIRKHINHQLAYTVNYMLK